MEASRTEVPRPAAALSQYTWVMPIMPLITAELSQRCRARSTQTGLTRYLWRQSDASLNRPDASAAIPCSS